MFHDISHSFKFYGRSVECAKNMFFYLFYNSFASFNILGFQVFFNVSILFKVLICTRVLDGFFSLVLMRWG